jgi:hypothetical protein
VSDALTGITMSAAIFGGVPAAAGFHAAGVEVRDGRRRDAAAEAGRRHDLASRARCAAAIGDRLIVDTAALARAVAPVPPGDR